MSEEFIPLGEQSPEVISRKLREIGDDEAAQVYETQIAGYAEGFHTPREWLNKGYQYGFIPLFELGKHHLHPILSASNIPANESLKNQRINIHLHRFHVHEYPLALTQSVSQFLLGTNVHTVLFTFEAHNQTKNGSENVTFHQVYEVVAKQDAGVTGYPIFLGLNLGNHGIGITCKTINIGSSNDQMLVNGINSEAMKMGLHLLATVQPGLTPFVSIAQKLATALANRSKNVPAQQFTLGLDFAQGATGPRLDIGTYVAVQVPHATTIQWQDWCYDANTDTVVRKKLAEGEEAYTLPYNTIMFRISKYQKT